MMAFYKIIFEIEKIVEHCDYEEALNIAKDSVNRADLYNYHCYVLSADDLQQQHNINLMQGNDDEC